MARASTKEAAGDAGDRHPPASQAGREAEAGGSLVLKLPGPELTVEGLQGALAVIEPEKKSAPPEVLFDFSGVDELIAPWSLHWAILIRLSRRICVHVRGLHGQPFQVARLYRRNTEIQKIVGFGERARLRPAA